MNRSRDLRLTVAALDKELTEHIVIGLVEAAEDLKYFANMLSKVDDGIQLEAIKNVASISVDIGNVILRPIIEKQI